MRVIWIPRLTFPWRVPIRRLKTAAGRGVEPVGDTEALGTRGPNVLEPQFPAPREQGDEQAKLPSETPGASALGTGAHPAPQAVAKQIETAGLPQELGNET